MRRNDRGVHGNGRISNGNHRILVVDDEPSIVDAVATALRYEGYEVEQASSGDEAIATARAFDPDLVVLDWMLQAPPCSC